MLVRLLDYDRALTGTAQAPLARFPLRTFRHDGMLYERVSDGADGVWEYRATERTPLAQTRTATVIDAHGNDVGTVAIAAVPPGSVTHAGCVCPLWTLKDAAGRTLYYQPAPEAA